MKPTQAFGKTGRSPRPGARRCMKHARRSLAVDVGGTRQILASGEAGQRELLSGPTLTAAQMVEQVKARWQPGWSCDRVTVG